MALINVATPIVSQFSCSTGNISNTASITVDTASITGGSGNYTLFEFINNQGTADASDDVVVQFNNNPIFTSNDKNGGNYTINVYYDKGCLGSTNAIINPFNPLTDISIVTDKLADCNTGASITVNTNAEVNSANKSYLISNTSGFSDTNTTGVFTNLIAGIYTIRVTNLDTNCFLETIYEVDEPNEYELVVTKEKDNKCFNDDSGSISFEFAATTIYSDNYNYVLIDNNTNIATTISGTNS